MTDGDIPDETGSGNAAGRDGDEAVWLDLIARFAAPARADEARPWPDREDIAGPVHVAPGTPSPLPEVLPGEPPTNPTGLPGLPVLGNPPAMPDQPWLGPGAAAGHGRRDSVPVSDPADDHYVPPEPPPLPRLDPITKLAWLALFGGPLYLLISTALGIAIAGFEAFLAVAAFVGGFVILVLRMDNGRPPDSGSNDDGAVV